MITEISIYKGVADINLNIKNELHDIIQKLEHIRNKIELYDEIEINIRLTK